MAYERLSRLIERLAGKPIQVSDAFLFKFGALLIAEELPDDDEVYQYTAEKDLRDSSWSPPPNVVEEIRDALEKHPNVFRLKETFKREQDHTGECTGMLVTGSVFTMEVHLPQARQEFKDRETPEEFNVISSGSYFAAYSPIDDIPAASAIAHEFRQLARKQIETSTRYKAPLFGPCPAHPDVIVVRTSGGGGIPYQSYEHDGNLYIIYDTTGSTGDVMDSLFFMAGRYWHGYYEALLDRCDAIELDVEIQNRFSAVSETVAELLTISAWRFWAVNSLSRRAALGIARLHELLLDYNSLCWSYDNFRRDMLDRTKEQPLFSKLQPLLAKYSRRDFRPPQSIAEALSFLGKQIEVGRNVRSIVVASVIGALVGAFLTAMIGLLPPRSRTESTPAATVQKSTVTPNAPTTRAH
jgi:hypothetical protein